MTTVAKTRPLSVRDAACAVRDARDAIGRHGAVYARVRTGVDKQVTARAHSEFSFAILDFVNACVALAETEDRVDPVSAAARNRQPISTAAGPVCDQAWSRYQDARRSGDRDAVDAARGVWHDAFLDWHMQLHKRNAAEDQDQAEKASRRLDESNRLHPGDAFPQPGGHRAAVVSESREGERKASIRRADAGLGSPWVRESRGRRLRAEP